MDKPCPVVGSLICWKYAANLGRQVSWNYFARTAPDQQAAKLTQASTGIHLTRARAINYVCLHSVCLPNPSSTTS